MMSQSPSTPTLPLLSCSVNRPLFTPIACTPAATYEICFRPTCAVPGQFLTSVVALDSKTLLRCFDTVSHIWISPSKRDMGGGISRTLLGR